MSIHTRFAETETTPAEYFSDNEQACAVCRTFLDLDEEDHVELDELVPGCQFVNQIACRKCVKTCKGCGEPLTSPSKAIRLRCHILGTLEPWCVECAVEEWSSRLLDYANANEYFLPWPMADFPRLGNGNREYEASELGGDQIARLYRFMMEGMK